MPQYLSPGVYVEEVPSGNAPIAGVGTSTAGFVGVVAYSEVSTDPAVLLGRVLAEDITPVETFPTGTVVTDENFAAIREGVGADNKVRVSGPLAAVQTHLIGMTLQEEIVTDDGEIFPVDTEVDTTNFDAISQAIGSGKVKVTGPLAPVQTHLVGMTLLEEVTWTGETITSGTEIATAELAKAIADAVDPEQRIRLEPATPANVAALCTNFTQFLNAFGGFSSDNAMQNNLAHAVYGFFNNGGTRCWITRVEMGDGANEAEVVQATNGNLIAALDTFKPIDEIALVAIPGATDSGVQEAIMSHCENAGDRFAIIDGQRTNAFTPEAIQGGLRDSNYAALYFPWITVYDPASNGTADVPPSGHLAGIYARVDTLRGVHKAPANEVIRGALGVEFRLSKAQHDGLNPDGINVIRQFNGNVTVWGARTLGGDDNTEWKYINVRRLFLFLRESIDEGTQWVVFEPNTPDLWAKITRNVSAFLTNVWRDGALFGATPQEAFYVKCDAETNPPEVRDLGQVVTEIGVAPVKPAEFVIFRISQWAGPAGG